MQASVDHPRSRLADLIATIRHLNRDRVYAVLMILPSIILLGIFVYGFIGQTLAWSLTDWAGLDANVNKNYIGLKNYEALFSDITGMRFRQELVNTFFSRSFS